MNKCTTNLTLINRMLIVDPYQQSLKSIMHAIKHFQDDFILEKGDLVSLKLVIEREEDEAIRIKDKKSNP